jgi:hypothetical protein
LITRIYRELKKLNSPKNQWPNEEMGKWTEPELFQRKKSKWLKTHEKILTIPGHKGNENQNQVKILPHSY